MDRRESQRKPVRREQSGTNRTRRESESAYANRRRSSREEYRDGRGETIRRRPSQEEIEKARLEREERRAEARRRLAEREARSRQSAPKTQTSHHKTSRTERLKKPDGRPTVPPSRKRAKPSGQKKARKPIPLRVKMILAAAAALVVLTVLSLTVLFPVQSIKVEGETQYSEAEIVAASGIDLGANLFTCGQDSGEVILKEMPFIKTAVIRKKLPSTVVIEVTEATPMLCMEQDKQWYTMDADKKLLEITDKKPKDLIVVKGMLVDKAEPGLPVEFFEASKVKALEELSQIFLNNQIQGMTWVDLEDSLDVRLLYENRLVIKLGIPNELDIKVRHAMTVIQQKLKKTDQGLVDISGGKNVTYNPNYDLKSGN